MKNDKRMEKIETNLTPQQFALVWLKDANRYPNLEEYLKYLKNQPEEMRPVRRITDQVAEATQEAMKGFPKETIQRAIRKAQKDVLFLIKLHHQLNYHFLTEERVWYGLMATMMEKYECLTWQSLYQNYVQRTARLASREIPFPVIPKEGAAISAAIRYHVTTWEELPEQEILEGWLRDYLLDQGVVELPEGSYGYDDEGNYSHQVNEENEQAIRACFQNEAAFERFRSGEDFTKGFSSISDAEYNRHYDLMVNELRKSAEVGEVKEGVSVFLETVPIPYLMNVPLVEGEWIDAYVVELAELGALLKAKSYQLDTGNDDHLLAWPCFIDKDGVEIHPDEVIRLRKRVSSNFKKYQERTKQIDGRPYISFKDYSEWKGRMVKGELASELCPGFITASWNQWLDKQGTKGCLGDVLAHTIDCYVTEHDYRIYGDGTHEGLERRASLLDSASFAHSSMERQTATWKEMTGTLLRLLYTFREALTAIKQNYYKGEEVLFPDLARSLSDLIKYAEDQVKEFNHEFAEKAELRLDVESIKREAGKKAPCEIVNFIDFAKADALDELGEERAATEIMEKHIMP